MLDNGFESDVDTTIAEKKRAALEILADAFDEAEAEGIERDIISQAALFTVMSDLVDRFGERAVVDFAGRLPARIEAGDFTVGRSMQ